MPPKKKDLAKKEQPVPKTSSPVKASKPAAVSGSSAAKNVTKSSGAKTSSPIKNATKTTAKSSKTNATVDPVSRDQSESSAKNRRWTREDDAASKIQSLVRKFLAKRQLQKKRAERVAYEEKMELLEREAFAKMVRMHQEEMERERQKEMEEKRRRKEMLQRQKRFLEAAFEGDNDELIAVLKEVKEIDDKNGVGNDIIGRTVRAKNQLAMVDCADANNNTPLSEAANGGHAETIKLLVEKGADPNSRGQFQRTPLYRAAYAGHLEAVQALLLSGADPRLYAEDGQTPGQETSFEPIRDLLASWDIIQTDKLLEKLELDRERRRNEEKQSVEMQARQLEDKMSSAEKEYEMIQKRLLKATEELNKRITEHDTAIASGYARTDVTLQMIHDAEMDVEVARVDVEKAREKLAHLRLAVREKRAEVRGEEASAEEGFQSLRILVRELDDVLLRDVGDRIKSSQKWPLIIDPSGQAATFLRYRDTNYVNALSPAEMETNRIRLSILGALRYGKPLVLDMMEVDMYDACERRFDEIQKGLLSSILDKSIMKEETFQKLIRSADGPEYNKNQFCCVDNFRFFIVTKNPFPRQQLIDVTYPITVYMPNASFNA